MKYCLKNLKFFIKYSRKIFGTLGETARSIIEALGKHITAKSDLKENVVIKMLVLFLRIGKLFMK